MSTAAVSNPRTAITTGVLLGVAVLLSTHDQAGAGPHVFFGLALLVAFSSFVRSKLTRPWDGNDEHY